MNITLITPPSVFLLDERVFISLGILKVGASLEAAGHQVSHLDLSGITNYEEVVRLHATTTPPSFYAVTATTPQIPAAVRIARAIHQAVQSVAPGPRVILGGPHPTLTFAALRHSERARESWEALQREFDVIVCGDGEKAILEAIRGGSTVVNADDPKSALWMSNSDFDDSPWPARHLVDLDSYRYSIDGERAVSLIAQLGCLAPDTPIMLDSGMWSPIKDVQKGDRVLSFDVDENRYRSMPVSAVWQREAPDLWELAWDDRTTIKVTGEHPIRTSRGWETVNEIKTGRFCAGLPTMFKGFPGTGQYTAGEVLQSPLSMGVAADTCESGVAEVRTGGDARQVCGYDSGRTPTLLHSRAKQYTKIDSQNSQAAVRNQEGRSQSNETPGSGGEGGNHNSQTLGSVLLRSDETALEGRQTRPAYIGDKEPAAEQNGTTSDGDTEGSRTDLSVRGQWGVLGRPQQGRSPQEPGLRGLEGEESNPASRRVLAFEKFRNKGIKGLSGLRMDAPGSVVSAVETAMSEDFDPETGIVWRKLVSKKFIGAGTVHNITVHPVHNYFAAGMLVHNCPFKCAFCAGRDSAMLRRIRLRTSEDVVAEISQLYLQHGLRGFMFFDDEMNVNRQLLPLLRLLKKEADSLGIEWKLRGFLKAELFTQEQAEAMYEAGFRQVLIGFESGHDRILTNIEKNATREDNTRAVQIAHAAGLKVKALMSLGHAGESEETVLATRDWLLEVKPSDFDMTIIQPYPGSPYFDKAQPLGDSSWCYTSGKTSDKLYMLDVDFTSEAQYYKGAVGSYVSYVWTDHLSREQLVLLRDRVEKEVRQELNIPFYQTGTAIRYEHSMGAGIGQLPEYILRGKDAEKTSY
jgi:radical SAM superfamily enzyme YgiQ (UPF0313 family)